jgi:hypothetical protein
MTTPNQINWEQLATQLNSLGPNGESGSNKLARQAIEILLGEERLRQAVDDYVAGVRGSELARSVLWLLHPWSAMQRCYEIYRSAADAESKALAVELLRVIADERVLPWLAEFLNDPDSAIQIWGVGVLDQLLWSELIEPNDVSQLLREARAHTNPQVQERAAFIDSYLQDRAARDAQ